MEDKPYIDNEVDLSGPPAEKNTEQTASTTPSPDTGLDPRITVNAKPKITKRGIIYAVIVVILIIIQVAIIMMNKPPKRRTGELKSVTPAIVQMTKTIV